MIEKPRARSALAAIVATAFGLTLLLFAAPADAHQVGLSQGQYTFEAGQAVAHVVLSRTDVLSLVPSADTDRDGQLGAAELTAIEPTLADRFEKEVLPSRGGHPCTLESFRATLTEEDGAEATATYTCEAQFGEAKVDLPLLASLGVGHRQVAKITSGASTSEALLHKDARTLGMEIPTSNATLAFEFVKLGLEHILTGFDHLAFLFGLVLLRARLRSLLATITAFTIAHSVTLGIAVLGVWAPSPTYIEPMIALSVAYVGAENFFAKSGDDRWRITLPFGLIHGFGFAGALGEVGLPKPQIPLALGMFNVGVELGQLLVLAAVLPMLVVARKRLSWFEGRGVQVLSAVLVLIGVGWFIERTLLS